VHCHHGKQCFPQRPVAGYSSPSLFSCCSCSFFNLVIGIHQCVIVIVWIFPLLSTFGKHWLVFWNQGNKNYSINTLPLVLSSSFKLHVHVMCCEQGFIQDFCWRGGQLIIVTQCVKYTARRGSRVHTCMFLLCMLNCIMHGPTSNIPY